MQYFLNNSTINPLLENQQQHKQAADKSTSRFQTIQHAGQSKVNSQSSTYKAKASITSADRVIDQSQYQSPFTPADKAKIAANSVGQGFTSFDSHALPIEDDDVSASGSMPATTRKALRAGQQRARNNNATDYPLSSTLDYSY